MGCVLEEEEEEAEDEDSVKQDPPAFLVSRKDWMTVGNAEEGSGLQEDKEFCLGCFYLTNVFLL